MTDKEIALELTKMVISKTGLTTTKNHTYDVNNGEARFDEIDQKIVAANLAEIYNVICEKISKQA